ncbi:MAG: T9SS type A sorting domain-containing protein, partial [Bacteroidota bacterium]
LVPFSYTQITTSSTLNATGTNYWVCAGLTLTITSSQGANYVCENNVTVNLINTSGDNIYAKPGCLINNNSTQDISVICDPTTVTLNNNSTGSITVVQSCNPVVYDYSLIGGTGQCAVTGISETMLQPIVIFPNPATDKIKFQGVNFSENIRVQIFNALGGHVASKYFLRGEEIVFETDEFENGIYFVLLEDKDTVVRTGRFQILKR